MAFASGGFHGLRYAVESSFGVTPSGAEFVNLRHKSSSLVLSKDSLQSEELRDDAQIYDFRHGTKQVGGDIEFELSYGEYDPFLAAVVRGEWDEDVLKAGITVPYFTIERKFGDIGKYELFTGCAISKISLNMEANAMVTGTMSVVGKAATFSSGSADDTPTASQANMPLDCFSGAMKEGNQTIGLITSVSLDIDNGMEAAFVIGSDTAAAIIPKRINCSGTASAYFQDLDLMNKFINETETSLEITLGTGGPGSYKILLPRIKYTGATNSVQNEGPIMLEMPFQALLDTTAGSNIVITRIPIE